MLDSDGWSFLLGSSGASFDDTFGEYICGENIKNHV